jgi:hypothetical protein
MNSQAIVITVSDPWDVGEALGWKTIRGQCVRADSSGEGGRALIRFDEPLHYRDGTYRYAIASPRHIGRRIEEVAAGTTVDCVLIGISDEQAQSANALDANNWRGGLSFIGDIRPVV